MLDTSQVNQWSDLAARWQELAQQWAKWWMTSAIPPSAPAQQTVKTSAQGISPMFDARAVAELTDRFAPRFQQLWTRVMGGSATAISETATSAERDRRFNATAWRDQPYYAFIKDAYLLYAEYLTELASLAQLPPVDKRRLEFATRQYIDAIAPTNYPATNPEVMQRAMETDGASLLKGFANLIGDARKGRITMSDERAFGVGRNLAVTSGSVVFRNDLIELIQYDATTPSVHNHPLVMVPPCINKFYILDMRPENSFVRNVVDQGHTVFMISWRNVPQELGQLSWDDYLERGVLTAFDVARDITGSKILNTLGFCVGGTMLGCTLAVLAARGDRSVASATFLTTMLDYSDPGEIAVYISRESLAAREPALLAGQRIHGNELASAFASLRANELVWNYVVNNYLKGQTPPAFDLLYWNGDSTNLPGPMYDYYVKEMYIENRLRVPNALTMVGQPIDLRKIAMPSYVYASREDHIVPWRTAYRTTTLVGGETTFVLGSSGHIAGVVNPITSSRRSYWTNDTLQEDAEDWLVRAQNYPGSWWPHWYAWLARHGGAKRRAPQLTGNAGHPPLAPAPGSYVLEPAS
ncbi:MAG TPA: class I poly(R)-hydroxyalkanoic acid synthase [Casimicrobiaceae bacterium]